jgi:long-chain acyl-CoA synthetase
MTELSPLATLLSPEDHVGAGRAERAASLRRSRSGRAEAKIVDADDHPFHEGRVGEIAIRSDVVMMGIGTDPRRQRKP